MIEDYFYGESELPVKFCYSEVDPYFGLKFVFDHKRMT